MYIRSINGKCVEKDDKFIVIGCGNFEYLLRCTLPALDSAKVGSNCNLLVYQDFKEDDVNWYGFSMPRELEIFKKLITVTGLGPAKAIKVLGYPTDIIEQAIALEDRRLFLSIPGFGIKLTEKLFLEIGKHFKIK